MLYVKESLKQLMPEGLRMAQLVLRRATALQQAGVIFVHVPKNGGTSINNAIYGRFMGHFRVSDIERVRPHLLRSLPSFAVTRNPWARAYSAWNFARAGAAMNDGAQIRTPARYQTAEFESFERFVLEWLPSRNLSREDYVFRPQSQFLLTHRGEIGVRHLGHIENTGSYLPFLEETIGREIKISHLNRTAHTFSYREAYTNEMRDMLARCYSIDLERFNYDF